MSLNASHPAGTRPISIPVVAIGPGSQPKEDVALDIAPMPTLSPAAGPRVPEQQAPAHLAAAADLLAPLVPALRLRAAGGAQPRLVLGGVDDDVVRVINESLGEGDVSIVVGDPRQPRVRIQETALPGLWRVRHFDAEGRLEYDVLEACDIPQAVRAALAREPGDGLLPMTMPNGVMNAPALLREIEHRSLQYVEGDAPHAINLTLLPLSPEDRFAIDKALGRGCVAMLSRGFGNCRIGATTLPGVWRVQYYNSMETLLLDTIEITALPEVAVAAEQDLDDSTARLVELLDWLRASAQDERS
jgi:hydrogenase-1 operon protein HyaF